MRPIRRGVLFPFCLLSAACGTADGPAFTVRDSLGITIAESARPVGEPSEVPQLATEPTTRIGTVDGDPEYQLVRVTGVARLSSGEVVVADGGSQEIRWFDAEGRFIRKRGGPGDGPGEYRFVRTVRLLPGDSILVEEVLTAELRHYTPAGDLVRTWKIPSLGRFTNPPPIGSLPGGGYLAMTERTLSPPPGHVLQEATLIRYDERGSADTIAVFPGGETYLHPCGPNNAGICNVGVPYGIRASAAIQGGRVVAGNGDQYELRVFDPAAGLVALYRRSGAAVPLSADQVARYRDSVVEAVPPARRAQVLELQQTAPVRTTMPAYFQLLADAAGRLWVARAGAGPTRPWDLFDGEGRWLGAVEVPGRLQVMQIDGEAVTGIARDADGVEFIEVYRFLR